MFVAPQLARVALKFGPPEYFAITLFGMTIVVSISGKEMLKGFIMACLGLLISKVGIDRTEGVARLTFGLRQLYRGLAPVTVMLGTFAVCEVPTKRQVILQLPMKQSQSDHNMARNLEILKQF